MPLSCINASKKVAYIGLDINNEPEAMKVLQTHDLAIIALGPMDKYGAKAHRLCLKAKLDVVDINDSLKAADEILALHDEAKQSGCRIFTGMGFAPGLSTLLLTKLAREHASVSGDYCCRLYMGAAYGGGETSPYAVLASFNKTLEVFTKGRRTTVKTPWKDESESFHFPAQAKPLALIPFSSPEVAGLASDRCPSDLEISSFDTRYHIQYLSQGFARLLAHFNLGESALDFFAKKFFSGGQSMKAKKDADPDTCLWVYPANAPEQGLMVHGIISSYDLTALMACAVTDIWLEGGLVAYQGVFATEHLSLELHSKLQDKLAQRGISIRRARPEVFKQADTHFGWADTPVLSVEQLRNYGKNWYNFDKAHPKMALLQKRFLLNSGIWSSLKQSLSPLKFLNFVFTTMSRWRSHNKQLVAYRQSHDLVKHACWKAITKDISMFTSGYSRARDILGAEKSFEQYRVMFLDTGKMEMRWLWPKPEIFSTFAKPEQAIIDYWLSFMSNYSDLGLFDFSVQTQTANKIHCTISNCAYAKMFSQLDCAELANLVREMEQEALSFICSQAQINIDWQAKGNGDAQVRLEITGSSAVMEAEQAIAC